MWFTIKSEDKYIVCLRELAGELEGKFLSVAAEAISLALEVGECIASFQGELCIWTDNTDIA